MYYSPLTAGTGSYTHNIDMDQLAYKATKAMVGYKVNNVTKSVKEELGFNDDKKKEDSEHDKQKRLASRKCLFKDMWAMWPGIFVNNKFLSRTLMLLINC